MEVDEGGQEQHEEDRASARDRHRRVPQEIVVHGEGAVDEHAAGEPLPDEDAPPRAHGPGPRGIVEEVLQRQRASAATSPGATRRPVSPSSTLSGMPPARVATTGRPCAIASSVTRLEPS